MMSLAQEILQLALAKKRFSNKCNYIIKGIFFLPFLIVEKKQLREKNQGASKSLAGDDIYPLF